MNTKTMGIDLGTRRMHVVALEEQGHAAERRVFSGRSA